MKAVVVLALLTATLFAATAIYTTPLRPSIPALQFTYSETAFWAIVDAWPTGGLARFKNHLLIDFPFLLCYGALGYLVARRTTLLDAVSTKLKTALTYCLPIAAGADAIENVLHLMIISSPTPHAASLYAFAGTAAAVKWGLDACYVCGIAYVCYAGYKRYQRASAAVK